MGTTTPNNAESLKRIVARTNAIPNGSTEAIHGTAFLLTLNYALTCAHCLGNQNNWAKTINLVFREWSPANHERIGTVVGEPDWEHDAALVILDQPAPDDIPRFQIAENADASLAWETQAYPAVLGTMHRFSGTVSSPTADHADIPGRKVMTVECEQIKQKLDHVHGTSGGPVLVNGVIAGMLSNQLMKEDESQRYKPGQKRSSIPLFGALYAQPLGSLATLFNSCDPPIPLLPPATASVARPSSDDDLSILLKKVKEFWIDGVRATSLDKIIQLELGKESYARAIEHPWEEVIGLDDQHVQTLPPNTRIIDIFKKAGDFLLILGEPGSGKTMTLLDLASDLIAAAETDPRKPIPVVLNLSTWKESDSDLNSWTIRELKSKYFVQERLGKKWLKESRLLLMLDGLDEVRSSARAHCVKEINAFLEQCSPHGMVASCRFAEYEDLPLRLRFRGAVKLLPLTMDQIDQYLAATGLDAIRAAVQGDAQLRELARTPLVLNIMMMAYKDEKHDAIPIETNVTRDQLTKSLMNRYITKMFGRKGSASKQSYTQQTVLHSLSWLAQRLVERSQTVLLIESLQPDWLSGRAAWLAYWVGTRVTWAAVYGLFIIGAFVLLKLANIEVIESVRALDSALGFISLCCVGGTTGFIDGQLYTNKHTAHLTSKGIRFLLRMLFYSGAYLLMLFLLSLVLEAISVPTSAVFPMVFAIACAFLFVGPVASFRSIKRDACGDIVTKAFGWSWKRSEQGYIWAVFSLLAFYGIAFPIGPIFPESMPPVVRAIAVCTTIIGLAWPYFRYRTQGKGQISFLSKVGMATYISASRKLVFLPLAVSLIMFFGHTLLVEGATLTAGNAAIAYAAFVAMLFFFGVLVALLSGIKPNVIESTAVPNQGITLTLRHAVLSSTLVFLIILLALGVIFAFNLAFNDAFQTTDKHHFLLVSAIYSCIPMTVGLWYGAAVLRHFVLRFLLYRKGYIPKDFVRFLDYSTSLIFLRKVGGGYVFIHRIVMEHFASLKDTPPKLSPAVKIATGK